MADRHGWVHSICEVALRLSVDVLEEREQSVKAGSSEKR